MDLEGEGVTMNLDCLFLFNVSFYKVRCTLSADNMSVNRYPFRASSKGIG